MKAPPHLGFIGMGLMGAPMTLRLLRAGYKVAVWNRSPGKLAPVVAAGAVAVDSPAAVARAAGVVFLCVTDTEAAEAVVFGPQGVAEEAAPGTVLVDFSSIRPDATRAMAARLAAATGMAWIDAPVSGGVAGAEDGSLAIMAGGDAAAIESVRFVVGHLCARFTHMGPSGAGQSAKMINQVIVGSTLAVLAEAVNLAQRAGIDAGRLTEALAGGFADSRPLQLFVPRMAERRFSPPLGHIHTMLKDLDTATDLARHAGAALPMATTAAELLRLYAATGHDQDCATSLITLWDKP